MKGHEYEIPVEIPGLLFYHHAQSFPLEFGGAFHNITLAYHTYGLLNEAGDNVIWVCHALTANSNVADWWSGLFGKGKLFDPTKYFIVCSNILGSCYGSTGPRSINPASDEPYGMDWPLVTIRDWVNAQELLRNHLRIKSIALCVGGSCGGHQVLELALLIPDKIERLGLLVTSSRETAWVIASHEAQRLAMEADPLLYENENHSGDAGMKAARGTALLGYRTFESYVQSQTDHEDQITDQKASTYIRHQGEKLVRRFYPHCYYHLTKSLDTHHVGRGRGPLEDVLQSIQIHTTLIGIDSDRLIPVSEQLFLADHIPNVDFHVIHSIYGHDGFLIESEKILEIFLSSEKQI